MKIIVNDGSINFMRTNVINPSFINEGKFIKTDGTFTENENFSVYEYPITNQSKVTITTNIGTNSIVLWVRKKNCVIVNRPLSTTQGTGQEITVTNVDVKYGDTLFVNCKNNYTPTVKATEYDNVPYQTLTPLSIQNDTRLDANGEEESNSSYNVNIYDVNNLTLVTVRTTSPDNSILPCIALLKNGEVMSKVYSADSDKKGAYYNVNVSGYDVIKVATLKAYSIIVTI